MVLLGIDIGTNKTVVSSPIRHVLQIVLNEQAKRSTKSAVCYAGPQEGVLAGDAALNKRKRNPGSTMIEFIRLIGRRWGDHKLKEDAKLWGFKLVPDTTDSRRVAVEVETPGGPMVLAPEQIVASYLRKIKESAIITLGLKDTISDCAIAVPSFFTEAQRNAIRTAGRIAGFNVLRVVNQLTASALNFGIHQPRMAKPAEKDGVVMKNRLVFIDVGHGNTQCTIAEVVGTSLESMRFLHHEGSPYAGGRDMIRAMMEYFATDIKEKFGVELFGNTSKQRRLQVAVEAACLKMKKVLTGNSQAHHTIEYFYDDRDYRMSIDRETFNKLIQPTVDNILKVVETAIGTVMHNDAQAAEKKKRKQAAASGDAATEEKPEKIETTYRVEITGGVVRVPNVQERLKATCCQLPGVERLFQTLNGDESIAKGCALICAMTSAQFRVRKYLLEDCQVHNVNLHWNQNESTWQTWIDKIISDGPKDVNTFTPACEQLVCSVGERAPVSKLLNLEGVSTLVALSYRDPEKIVYGQQPFIGYLCANVDSEISQNEPDAKLNVKCSIDIDLRTLMSTDVLVRKKQEEEAPPPPEDQKASTDMDVDGDEKTDEAPSDDKAAEKAPDAAPADKPKESEKEVKKKKKKKMKKIQLQTKFIRGNHMTEKQIIDAVTLEAKMADHDLQLKVTAETRNRVEECSYKLRESLHEDNFRKFVKAEEAELMLRRVADICNWLDDEDPDVPHSKEDLEKRYKDLLTMCEPVWKRQKEHDNRPLLIMEMKKMIGKFEKVEEKAWIEEEKRKLVLSKCTEADSWLANMIIKQEQLPLYENPFLTAALLREQMTLLNNCCKPIFNTPEPIPEEKEKTEEEKATEAASAEPNPAPETEPAPAADS